MLAPWVEPEKRKALLGRADTLASWCLPMLSKAIRAQEEEDAALELLHSIERLKARKEARENAGKVS